LVVLLLQFWIWLIALHYIARTPLCPFIWLVTIAFIFIGPHLDIVHWTGYLVIIVCSLLLFFVGCCYYVYWILYTLLVLLLLFWLFIYSLHIFVVIVILLCDLLLDH